MTWRRSSCRCVRSWTRCVGITAAAAVPVLSRAAAVPLAVVAVPCSQTRFRLQSTEQEARTAVAALKAKLVHAEQAAAKQAQSLAAVKGLHAASDQARRASLSSLQHTDTHPCILSCGSF